MIETVVPDYVTARQVDKPLSILAANKTPHVWLSLICRPRAYWIESGRRMDGPITTDDYLEMDVFIPEALYENKRYNTDSLKKIEGFAEKAVSDLKTGEIIQFERFGFVRIEKSDKNIIGYFTHK